MSKQKTEQENTQGYRFSSLWLFQTCYALDRRRSGEKSVIGRLEKEWENSVNYSEEEKPREMLYRIHEAWRKNSAAVEKEAPLTVAFMSKVLYPSIKTQSMYHQIGEKHRNKSVHLALRRAQNLPKGLTSAEAARVLATNNSTFLVARLYKDMELFKQRMEKQQKTLTRYTRKTNRDRIKAVLEQKSLSYQKGTNARTKTTRGRPTMHAREPDELQRTNTRKRTEQLREQNKARNNERNSARNKIKGRNFNLTDLVQNRALWLEFTRQAWKSGENSRLIGMMKELAIEHKEPLAQLFMGQYVADRGLNLEVAKRYMKDVAENPRADARLREEATNSREVMNTMPELYQQSVRSAVQREDHWREPNFDNHDWWQDYMQQAEKQDGNPQVADVMKGLANRDYPKNHPEAQLYIGENSPNAVEAEQYLNDVAENHFVDSKMREEAKTQRSYQNVRIKKGEDEDEIEIEETEEVEENENTNEQQQAEQIMPVPIVPLRAKEPMDKAAEMKALYEPNAPNAPAGNKGSGMPMPPPNMNVGGR